MSITVNCLKVVFTDVLQCVKTFASSKPAVRRLRNITTPLSARHGEFLFTGAWGLGNHYQRGKDPLRNEQDTSLAQVCASVAISVKSALRSRPFKLRLSWNRSGFLSSSNPPQRPKGPWPTRTCSNLTKP